jgi:DNA-binding transcriptional regulator YbjK
MDARRTLISDASLTIVGEHGVRALTHHRIDDEAGIARGSTSYYCRRRVDILHLALERLYALDLADIQALVDSVAPGQRGDKVAIQEAVADLILRWLDAEHRPRSIARIELFMAASHEPELQPVIGEQFASIARTVQPLSGHGSSQSDARTAATFMLADGLLLMVLRQGLDTPSRDAIVGLLDLLAAETQRA